LRLFSRPSSSEIKILSGNRNKLPGNKTVHSLELKYEFNLIEGGKITPCLPAINNYVYDGELAGQMVILCNKNEKVLGVGDIYAETTQVQKGDYKVYVCLKHEDPTFLETFKDIVLHIDKKIDAPINVPIHGSYSDAIQGKSEVSKLTLAAGEKLPLFVGKVADDKMPKDASPGRILIGSLHVGLKNDGKAAPGSYQISFTIPPKKVDGMKKDESPEKEEVKDLLEKAIRDAKLKVLQDIPSDQETKYMTMYESMKKEYPDHLPLFLEELKRAKADFLKEGEPSSKDRRLRALNAIYNINGCIDKSELAIFLAKKCHEDGAEANKQKKEMEDKKGALLTALTSKFDILLRSSFDDKSIEKEEIDRAFVELREWVDTGVDSEYLILHAKKESFDGRYAMAIKTLNKVILF
jgi:tripeptidyl-peptidase-2